MYAVERENNYNNERILDVIRHEIEKIRRSMPKSYDGIAQFLAISRPIIEVVLMNCGDWTDQCPKEGRGKKPFSHTSLMLIHILAKIINVSYRQVERELNSHPCWLKALQMDKAPSHSKLSHFRNSMGDNFFKDFFYNLNNLLYNLGLIGGEEFIIDSAPIHASVNFARANCAPKLNMEHVRAFFSRIDVSVAVKHLKIKHKSKYKPEAIIRFFMFEKLGGFKSRAQALKFVKDTPGLSELLGFSEKGVPNQSTLNYFIKKHGSVPDLLKPLVDQVTKFFCDFD